MEKFRKLGIIEPILKLLQEEKFVEPTEIQEKSIPLILSGKDVIAGAATGSGKTLAFAAAIIKSTERGEGIQSLVLVPTRELAEQVYQWLKRFSKHKRLEMTAIYGGVSINPQIDQLRTADVVIGTPGRILDHLSRRTVDFSQVKILVLDEADRMLDMGFKDDVERIISRCPRERQTLLFSATIHGEVEGIARKYMRDPVEVSAEVYVDPAKLNQVYYDVEDNQKFSLLVHLLKHEHSGLIMIFCNTQRNTDFIAKNLNAQGINTIAIHGGHSQNRRTSTMQKFTSNRVSVLVCTDVAARGLDIKGVSHVYNYDSPKDCKDYIHRIGRTARAGKEGKVINLLIGRDYENFQRIFAHPDFKITKEETPAIERLFLNFREERGGFGRERGGRSSRGNDFSRGRSRYSSYSENKYSDNRGYKKEGSTYSKGNFYSKKDYKEKGNRDYSGNRENRGNASRGGFQGKKRQGYSSNYSSKRKFSKRSSSY